MARYSIEDTTLIGMADALRRRHGETRWGTYIEEVEVPSVSILKTPNATGFDSYEGLYADPTKEETIYEGITIPGAHTIKAKVAFQKTDDDYLYIAPGYATDYYSWKEIEDLSERIMPDYSYGGIKISEFTFENTNSVTLFLMSYKRGTKDALGYYAEVWGLDADGNLLESQIIEVEKEGEIKNTFNPLNMAELIDSIKTGDVLPDNAFVISGNCSYRFFSNGWSWFIEQFGDRITTKGVSNCSFMFNNSDLQEIPFDINCQATSTNILTLQQMFNGAKIRRLPRILNCKPDVTTKIFSECNYLREIPDDICDTWDWSGIDTSTSSYGCNRSGMLSACYSLRSFPMKFHAHGVPTGVYSYSIYNTGFQNCYVLDEIVGLPFPHYNATWTSNSFSNTFSSCGRVNKITFALQDDGTPHVVNWKAQTIDLTQYTGWLSSSLNATNWNSGITIDKRVTDDATYQALKDDPDWYTTDFNYSRFNHDSAVELINSLPDASAYIASAGGTNTIKFKGAAGSKTDGGAINTLTEEELAAAIVKGWTVTFA